VEGLDGYNFFARPVLVFPALAATTWLSLGCSRFFDGFEGGLQILLEHFQILMDLWLTTQRISIECWHGGTPLIIFRIIVDR